MFESGAYPILNNSEHLGELSKILDKLSTTSARPARRTGVSRLILKLTLSSSRPIIRIHSHPAGVVKLVDTTDSKSVVRKDVSVQVRPPVTRKEPSHRGDSRRVRRTRRVRAIAELARTLPNRRRTNLRTDNVGSESTAGNYFLMNQFY